ncbi:MAG: hypothetical protein ACPLN2_08225 [Thermoproteota archaeon]
MDKQLSLIQLLILHFADTPNGIDDKEISRKIGINAKKLMNRLAKDELLEKIPRIGKSGKPLKKSSLYRTSQKGREQYKKFFDEFLGEPVKCYLLKDKVINSTQALSKEYAGSVEQINRILKNFGEKLDWVSKSLYPEEAKKTEQPIVEKDSFLNALRLTYFDLVQRSPVAPLVKVSDLRNALMEQLNITRETFDKLLVTLNEEDPYKVQLYTGSGSEEEGVKTKRGMFHLVLIKSE